MAWKLELESIVVIQFWYNLQRVIFVNQSMAILAEIGWSWALIQYKDVISPV